MIDYGTEREILDWTSYGQAVRELATMVAEDGYKPEVILAIARGGLFCAGSLAYALTVKTIFVMNCEYYTGVGERLPTPVLLPPHPHMEGQREAKVLIAEDVADTGRTLKVVHETCSEQVGEVRTAVLYEKPQSLVQCEYVWKRTERWISFPWSSEPPVVDDDNALHKVLDA